MTDRYTGHGGFYYPSMAISVPGKFLVSNDSRISIYNSSTPNYVEQPNYALGQEDIFRTFTHVPINAYALNFPVSMYSNGTFLAVCDRSNNRVLIWNNFPTSGSQSADIVLGQPDFLSNTANNGGRSASSLNAPRGVYWDGTHFIVGDTGNHRVLIWNGIPSTNNQTANLVLGQSLFTTGTANNGGRSASSLSSPYNIWSDGTKLLVADYGNHRALIWNTFPTVNMQSSDLVLGQPNFTSGTANNGGISASTLNRTMGLVSYGGKIAMGDYVNHRLLIWNSWPTVNGQAADVVWGQPDFTSNLENQTGISNMPGPLTLDYPHHISIDSSGRLIVADNQNQRILVFNTIPTSNSVAPDFVLGQRNFSEGRYYSSSLADPNYAILWPSDVITYDGKLIVVDTENCRVLIWNHVPKTSAVKPDIVLGQTDFSKFLWPSTTSSQSLSYPTAAAVDSGGRLYVADQNRILIWNSIPTENSKNADLVLGQPDFTTNTANMGGRSASSLNQALGINVIGNRLVVSEYGNRRVLIWNSLPTSNNQPADIVLGQANFTTATGNFGGLSASAMNRPRFRPSGDGTKLIVTDQANNRVLIWNSWPTVNNQSADVVLGQPNFTSNTANNGGVSGASLSGPGGTFYDNVSGKLFIADVANHRILVWNSIPTVNGQVADSVIGQQDLVSNKSEPFGRGAMENSSWPISLIRFEEHLFTVEQGEQIVKGVKYFY